jgi:hypothetical protein
VLSDYRGHGFRGIVAKPYVIQELGEALFRVIQGKADPAMP